MPDAPTQIKSLVVVMRDYDDRPKSRTAIYEGDAETNGTVAYIEGLAVSDFMQARGIDLPTYLAHFRGVMPEDLGENATWETTKDVLPPTFAHFQALADFFGQPIVLWANAYQKPLEKINTYKPQ